MLTTLTKNLDYIEIQILEHKLEVVKLHTWTPSMTQRSPMSKGCMMKTKMIASKTVLQVPWNATPIKTVCVIQNNIIFIVATSITKRVTIIIITHTTQLANL